MTTNVCLWKPFSSENPQSPIYHLKALAFGQGHLNFISDHLQLLSSDKGFFFGEYINAGIYIKGDGKVKYTKTVTLDFDMIGRLEKLKEKREFDSFSSMLRAGLRKLLEEEGL